MVNLLDRPKRENQKVLSGRLVGQAFGDDIKLSCSVTLREPFFQWGSHPKTKGKREPLNN